MMLAKEQNHRESTTTVGKWSNGIPSGGNTYSWSTIESRLWNVLPFPIHVPVDLWGCSWVLTNEVPLHEFAIFVSVTFFILFSETCKNTMDIIKSKHVRVSKVLTM